MNTNETNNDLSTQNTEHRKPRLMHFINGKMRLPFIDSDLVFRDRDAM